MLVVLPAEWVIEESFREFRENQEWEKSFQCRSAERLTRGPKLESEILGLEPRLSHYTLGTVALRSFGFEPPDESWKFVGTLGSMSDSGVVAKAELLTQFEGAAVLESLSRLDGARQKIVQGQGMNFGLVLEGKLDLLTTPFLNALGATLQRNLPQGSGDSRIKSIIENSVELLRDLELNRVRLEEGLQPIDILWPWGEGQKLRSPNLTILRMTPMNVLTRSFQLSGLSLSSGLKPIWGGDTSHLTTVLSGDSIVDIRPEMLTWSLTKKGEIMELAKSSLSLLKRLGTAAIKREISLRFLLIGSDVTAGATFDGAVGYEDRILEQLSPSNLSGSEREAWLWVQEFFSTTHEG